MKKLLSLIMITVILSHLISCRSAPPPERLLTDFIAAYGAEGTVYHSGADETDDGYIDPELLSRIYMTDGDLPEDFAIFLNSHPSYGAECGAFLCRDESELRRVTAILRERMALLDPDGDTSRLFRCGTTLFYSTMPDPDRVEHIFDTVV